MQLHATVLSLALGLTANATSFEPCLRPRAALGAPQESAKAPATTPAADLARLQELGGDWSGTLGYRDYRSDEWVTLPVDVACEPGPGAASLHVTSTFDEGGWSLVNREVWSVDAASGELVTLGLGREGVTFERRGIERRRLGGEGVWSIELVFEGEDNGERARLRRTFALDGDRFTLKTEFAPPSSEDWSTRNELVLERAAPPTPDVADLAGRWIVDLRPTPDSPPYTTEFLVEVDGDEITGTFYGAEIRSTVSNAFFDAPHIAFTTNDGTGEYATSARLVDGKLHGTTHSRGRGFLSVWTAERAE